MNYNILFLVPDILLILLFIKEHLDMRKCKAIFTCNNCGRFVNTIQHGDSCNKCHRKIKIKEFSCDHFMGFRHSYIDAKNERYVYEYSAYARRFIADLVIYLIFILALTFVSVSAILEMIG